MAPSVAHARAQGVQLAIEPSLRTDVSFVNTIRDSIDVCERTGIMTVIDFGNCWMERDFREVVARAAPYTALVQVGDAPIGSVLGPGQPPGGGGCHQAASSTRQGSRPETVVPAPGADRTSSEPPWACSRSAMPCRPVP